MVRRGAKAVAVLALGIVGVALAGCGGASKSTTFTFGPKGSTRRDERRAAPPAIPLAPSPCAFGGLRALVPAGPTPGAIAVADFDGDGRPDVVVANEKNDTLAILRGQGGGAFDAPVLVPTIRSPSALALGDFDRDGRMDLAVASGAVALVQIHLARAKLAAAGQYPSGRSNVWPRAAGLVAADLDGDGALDVAASNGEGHEIGILKGDGAGRFSPFAVIATGQEEPGALSAIDADGNGVVDLVATYSSGLLVAYGAGRGAFSAPQVIRLRFPKGLAVGDFNRDGVGDFAFGVPDYHQIGVALGTRGGPPRDAYPKATRHGAQPTALVAGDVNGDGNLDVVAVEPNTDAVGVYLGRGTGAFTDAAAYPTGRSPAAVALADVTGDGRPEIFVADRDDDAISILVNRGDGVFDQRAIFAAGRSPAALALADVNRDGVPDQVFTDNAFEGTVSVALGRGRGAFQPPTQRRVGTYPSRLAVADVNRDGWPDLVFPQERNPPAVMLLLGGPGGSFAPQPQQSPLAGYAADLEVADLNGDGVVDVAVADPTAGAVLLYWGTAGGLAPGVTLSGLKEVKSIALADFDGDRVVDVAAGTREGLRVSFGRGRGAFEPPVALGENEYRTDADRTLLAADLDRDGLPEILAPESGVVFKNLGGRRFALRGLAGGPERDGTAVRGEVAFVDDVDRDGRADLVVADANRVTVLRGAGDGAFRDRAIFPLFGSLDVYSPQWGTTISSSTSISAMVYADVDGDGRRDLLVGHRGAIDLLQGSCP